MTISSSGGAEAIMVWVYDRSGSGVQFCDTSWMQKFVCLDEVIPSYPGSEGCSDDQSRHNEDGREELRDELF
jgi:hypothetical protein